MAETGEETTANPRSIALAFAVAALQRGESPENMAIPHLEQRDSSRKSSDVGQFTEDQFSEESDVPPDCTAVNDKTTTGHSVKRRRGRSVPESEGAVQERLAKNRERNREHARRTRLRKKAQLETLRTKLQNLEAERQQWKQKIEECSVASILLGISSPAPSKEVPPCGHEAENGHREIIEPLELDEDALSSLTTKSGSRRKRFLPPTLEQSSSSHSILSTTISPLRISVDGQEIKVDGKSHINWKTGVYKDDTTGSQTQLTEEQLQTLRRERNRMHAKLTRDRKKSYIAVMTKMTDDLQTEVLRLKQVWQQQQGTASIVTPLTSPELAPSVQPVNPVKRARHGFALDGATFAKM